MKPALLILLATLFPGCVVVKERVRTEYKELPPQVIEKLYIPVPVEPEPPNETEKNKEAQNFA